MQELTGGNHRRGWDRHTHLIRRCQKIHEEQLEGNSQQNSRDATTDSLSFWNPELPKGFSIQMKDDANV